MSGGVRKRDGSAPPAVVPTPAPPVGGFASPRDAAEFLIERGIVPILLGVREKAPLDRGWQMHTLADATKAVRTGAFDDARFNVGAKLGCDSGDLADVDLDSPETVALAEFFLPPTLTFGRVSKPESHFLYRAPGLRTTQYKDPKPPTGKPGMLVEIRSNNKSGNGAAQTMAPGSTHPSGELVLFTDPTVEIAVVDPVDLTRRVSHLALAALLGRHWPPEGNRHNAALAAAGMFVRGGMTLEEATLVMEGVAFIASDEEWEDRVQAVVSTYEKAGA